MPQLRFENSVIPMSRNQTILEALLLEGHSVPNSCRSGNCQSCLLQVTDGPIPRGSQTNLRASQVDQKLILSCIARPADSDCLSVGPPTSILENSTTATIHSIDFMTQSIAKVILKTPAPLEFKAGQFINLVRSDSLLRSYSLANLPGTDLLELHVRRIPNGRMSTWLTSPQSLNETIEIRGPIGDCFYQAESKQPLLMAGVGTGLAPLLGVVRQALLRNHLADIYLFHGARNSAGLYMQDSLSNLSREHENLHYYRGSLEPSEKVDFVGNLSEAITKQLPDLKGFRVFLCGAPEFVVPMRKQAFLSGAHSKEIHADAFQFAPPAE